MVTQPPGFLDMRMGLVVSVRNLTILALLVLSVVFPVYIVDRLNLTTSISGTLTIIALATVIAAVTLPLLQLIRDIFHNLDKDCSNGSIACHSRL